MMASRPQFRGPRNTPEPERPRINTNGRELLPSCATLLVRVHSRPFAVQIAEHETFLAQTIPPPRAIARAPHSSGAVLAQDAVIDSMNAPSFRFASDKGQIELVDGKIGKALCFTFPENAKSVFATRPARATPDWDTAAGFSFWVKGDGSKNFAGLQLIWNEDYALRYDYAFPIGSTDWSKIVVPWRDLIPVLPAPKSNPYRVTLTRRKRCAVLSRFTTSRISTVFSPGAVLSPLT